MKVVFTKTAEKDFLYWKITDRRIFERIKTLIISIREHHPQGLGKPELLRFDLRGLWSRRITEEHRLVYRYSKERIEIVSCRYHYEK